MRGAGNVPDNLDRGVFRVMGGGFLFHGGDGAEELVGDVGQDGGAAGADAVLGEKEQKAGEEVVDGSGGGESGQSAGERGGEIGGGALVFEEFGVAVTKGRDFITGEAPVRGDLASRGGEAAS